MIWFTYQHIRHRAVIITLSWNYFAFNFFIYFSNELIHIELSFREFMFCELFHRILRILWIRSSWSPVLQSRVVSTVSNCNLCMKLWIKFIPYWSTEKNCDPIRQCPSELSCERTARAIYRRHGARGHVPVAWNALGSIQRIPENQHHSTEPFAVVPGAGRGWFAPDQGFCG